MEPWFGRRQQKLNGKNKVYEMRLIYVANVIGIIGFFPQLFFFFTKTTLIRRVREIRINGGMKNDA